MVAYAWVLGVSVVMSIVIGILLTYQMTVLKNCEKSTQYLIHIIEDRIHFRISYKKIVRNFMSIYYQKYIVKRKKFAEYFEVVLHFHIREKK